MVAGARAQRLSNNSCRKCLLASTALLLVVFGILFAIIPATPWTPPNPASFAESVKTAFAMDATRPYTPTPTTSLCADYFLFGAENLLLYRVHSLAAHLLKLAALWMLLRRIGLGIGAAGVITFLAAFYHTQINAVLQPEGRGVVAITLFSTTALLAATHSESKHWLAWMLGCSAACVFAAGASLFAALLVPTIPIAARLGNTRGTTHWKRLALPETILIASLLLNCYMAGIIPAR